MYGPTFHSLATHSSVSTETPLQSSNPSSCQNLLSTFSAETPNQSPIFERSDPEPWKYNIRILSHGFLFHCVPPWIWNQDPGVETEVLYPDARGGVRVVIAVFFPATFRIACTLFLAILFFY